LSGAEHERRKDPEAPARRVIRVMTWNALAGGWPRLDAIEAVIRDAQPDVIGLQEIERRTLDALAERLGMARVDGPTSGGRGAPVGLLSRWPIREAPSHKDAPLRNALLEALIEPPDAPPLRVFVVHLAGVYTAWRAGEWIRQRELRYTLAHLRQAQTERDEPCLLMGDFNSLAPGEPLRASRLLLRAAELDAQRAKGAELPGLPGIDKVLPPSLLPLGRALVALARWSPSAALLDAATGAYFPRAVIAETRAAGLVDLATAQPGPCEPRMTCPADKPAGRIDYIFANSALASRLIACHPLGDTPTRPVSAASDHRPVLATLALGQ
jgi:endonuclease/exonuclease/phosphatase family metal-dependent hydrolase